MSPGASTLNILLSLVATPRETAWKDAVTDRFLNLEIADPAVFRIGDLFRPTISDHGIVMGKSLLREDLDLENALGKFRGSSPRFHDETLRRSKELSG